MLKFQGHEREVLDQLFCRAMAVLWLQSRKRVEEKHGDQHFWKSKDRSASSVYY